MPRRGQYSRAADKNCSSEAMSAVLTPYRVENEVVSLALVLSLDAEFVFEIAATPRQVDHDPGGLPIPE